MRWNKERTRQAQCIFESVKAGRHFLNQRRGLGALLLICTMAAACSDSSNSRSKPIPIEMTSLTATEALSAMKAGDFTPTEYAAALLEQAENLDHLNAFIYLEPDEVMLAAEEATRKLRSGGAVGALTGLPIVVKDSVEVAGIPTTGGTPALISNVSVANAPFLQVLLDQGAYVFGKTNLTEMSMNTLGTNDFYGSALNPYDTSRVPGGSSSGTGVAVSARIAPVGIGEDTGGSIRVPAAWSGIVGFRPTSGRYSNAGIIPLAQHRDTPGPMTRSVDDVILIDSVVTGSPMDLPPADLEGLRVGIPPGYWDPLDAGVDETLQVVLDRLEESGAVLVREDVPGVLELSDANFGTDMFCSWFDSINGYLASRELGFDYYYLQENVATEQIASLMLLGIPGFIPQESCERSLSVIRPEIQQRFARYFDQREIQVILVPTVFFQAPPLGATSVVIEDAVIDTLTAPSKNIEPSAMAGIPSLSIPVGLTPEQRLPVGMMIEGPTGEDRRVMAIAKAIEALMPEMPPPELE